MNISKIKSFILSTYTKFMVMAKSIYNESITIKLKIG